MTSLNAHFVSSDDHDRLPFHPHCPRCREERLSGYLGAGALVSRRTQAAITASVLAFTSVSPAAAFAAGPDDELEGTAAPAQVEDVEGEGGFDVDATVDAEPSSPAAPAPAADRVVAAPVAADAEAVMDEEPDAVEPEAVPEDPEAAPDEPAAAVEAPAGAPVDAPAVVTPEVAKKKAKRVRRVAVTRRRVAPKRVVAAPKTPAVQAPTPTPAPPQAPAPRQAPAPSQVPAPRQAPAPRPASAVAVASPPAAHPVQPARPGEKTHVVERGESLWSIAADLLVDRDASPARIAKEVNRLWQLNRGRIGTGNPDLLLAGTELELAA